EKILAIEDPDSLKAEVDRFWLSNVGSQSQARQVISLYYERVEQANKQFTNFKEGWKTDMGMMYILFGPPWYVDTRLNEMLWSYAYDRSDPRYNFIFRRPRGVSEFFPFNNYLLQRDQSYFNIQYQQVERWLSGTILIRQL
ncbi:MAG: GWxTD domain-containing protein, partial [Bacteroidota bacterium]